MDVLLIAGGLAAKKTRNFYCKQPALKSAFNSNLILTLNPNFCIDFIATAFYCVSAVILLYKRDFLEISPSKMPFLLRGY
jgi:hypothetical protein